MAVIPHAPLVVPKPGDRTLPILRRKLRLLAARTLLLAPVEHASGLQRVLTAMLRGSTASWVEAIDGPDVMPHLLLLHQGRVSAEDALDACVPHLLAAIAPTLPEPILWDRPVSEVASPSERWVCRFDPPANGMVADAGGLEVEQGPGRRAALPTPDAIPAYHAITPALDLATVDTNPLAMVEDHPEKSGNAVDLGGHPAAEWVEALQAALALVELALPEWHAELPSALSRIVPVGFEPERHLSASYREAPGLAYLTLHPDPLTLAEAIVHEAQHSKLNAASWLDPVLTNGLTEWTESPVRPDLRPLWGLLLAVHAFVPVAALHQALADADHPVTRTEHFARRRAEVLAGNERGLGILGERGRPTDLGRRVLTGLIAGHVATSEAAPEPPPGIAEDALPPG